MSFILDALKKSENERQRTIGPSLADAPVRAAPTERPWWAVAVAALLVVNLAVLAIVLMDDDDAPPAAAPGATPPASVAAPAATNNAPATAPTAAAPPVSRPLVTTSPAVRSLAEEAGVEGDPYYDNAPVGTEYIDPSHPDLAAAANVPAGPPAVRQIAPPAVAPLPSRPNYDTRGANEVLPTASSLVATGTTLPDMRLDIHVYSNTPTERFVFINMRKYLEGQAITEGPTVERITPEGAVLNSQGLRFLLPRQ